MAELTNVPILSGNHTRGSMMCMTEHLSWVLGAWSCWPDLKVHSGACHWWPPQVPPSRHPVAPARMLWSRDRAPVNDIYRCPINGWMAVSLAGVRGCQYTLDWLSSCWPPEGVGVASSPIVMRVKHYFFMINCHLKFQIGCVCVFCFNSSRQSESHICIY